MYFCDNHTHSAFSFDGHDTVDALCESAIGAGLSEITVTDHYDIDCMMDGLYPDLDKDGARDAVFRAKEKYAGKLFVNYGVELGQANHRPAEASSFLAKYRYDCVLGSIHNLRDVPDFWYLKYELMTKELRENLFRRNLAEIAELTGFDGISVISHITYPYRYIRLAGEELDFSVFHDELCGLFRKIVQSGKTLEINTSTWDTCGMTMPHRELLKLYRDCGGERISVGSDAHLRERVGAHIADAYEMMRELGFRYATRFRNGKPECFPIG